MRGVHRTGRPEATTGRAADLALPRGRRAIPTHTVLHTRGVPVVPYVLTLLLLPALVVAGAMTTGWWATTGTAAIAQAAVGQGGDERGDGQGGDGSGGGVPAAPVAPDDVKGSMTVQQVIDAFPITAAQVFVLFGAAPDLPTSTQLKTLVESGSGMDIPALRTWLAGPTTG
ncbi:MAG: hypothetical protein ACOH2F_00465 [Cellulomonas sp.]